VHDQNSLALSASRRGLRASLGLTDVGGDITGTRQIHREDAPLADRGHDVDRTPQPHDDTVNERKTEAGPYADFLGGEEWIEDSVEDCRRHAASRIGNLQHTVILCGEGPRRGNA